MYIMAVERIGATRRHHPLEALTVRSPPFFKCQNQESMDQEEKREQVVQNITEMLRRNPFTFEFKVKKKPQGIKVIYEVTQEEMDLMMDHAAKKQKED